MTHNELKALIQSSRNNIVSKAYSLFQRSLSPEVMPWIREVESTAKRLKTSKITLIAVYSD